MAGKTLASMILNQFHLLISDKQNTGNKTDMSYPLTLLFGDQAPMVSLLSLIKADAHDTTFRSIPPFASAIIFELFSTGKSSSFPSSKNDLWVRFYFHNGTDYSAKQLTAFPTFGNGPSRTDMPWSEFEAQFANIAVPTVADWCHACSSASLFCTGVDEKNLSLTLPSSLSRKKKSISPTVAGVIGAIVTLVLAALLFGLAMLLGGLRFHRVEKRPKSELGGFKGSAKLASDPDVSMKKNGGQQPGISIAGGGDGVAKRGHERVGSWELRQKEFGGDLGERRRDSWEGIDEVAGRPVVPDERV